MHSLRVTAQDGSIRTIALAQAQVGIGRDASNAVVLDGVGVSSMHCVLEPSNGAVVLIDRGSTNGTWMGGKRVAQPVTLSEDDRFYVGPFLLQILRVTAAESTGPAIEISGTGPIVRGSGPHRRWRDVQAKLQRYAEQWDAADRPNRLVLGGDELRQAKRWLASPPPSSGDDHGRLISEFVVVSAKVAARRGVTAIALGITGVVVVGAAATLAVVFWPKPPTPTEVAVVDSNAGTSSPDDDREDDDGGEVPPPVRPRPSDRTPEPGADDLVADVEGAIEHAVIPGEKLGDIARRYGVDEADLVSWNLIDPDAVLVPLACEPPSRKGEAQEKPRSGQTLIVKKPRLRPLPQTCIEYEVEAGEGWSQVATRFGLEITRLREYNPTVTEVAAGQKVIVWIDPKPYKPREPRQAIAELTIKDTARSVGTPNGGRLEGGIQLPKNDAYTRKAENIMWGSAYMIKNLHKGIVTFRQDVDYDGDLIVADMSKKLGGHFDPHKSHQAGRDVDIWLPTLKGVYKTKYLGDGRQKERRPFWYEVDWYATWGLMRALIKTDAVEAIFLDIILQPYVYDAAKNMGATKAELDAWIQYPTKGNNGRVIVQHSADHFSHIHVRFKCAPWESDCKGDRGPPGD